MVSMALVALNVDAFLTLASLLFLTLHCRVVVQEHREKSKGKFRDMKFKRRVQEHLLF